MADPDTVTIRNPSTYEEREVAPEAVPFFPGWEQIADVPAEAAPEPAVRRPAPTTPTTPATPATKES